MKFKVGDRVMMNPSSRYYGQGAIGSNPSNVTGTVRRSSDSYLSVSWDNGTTNSYDDHDLDLVDPGDLIGYKLLKDTIEYPKDTVFIKKDEVYVSKNDEGTLTYTVDVVESKNDWFMPMYKPTQITILTQSGESVTVNKTAFSIVGEQPVSIEEAEKIFDMIEAVNLKTKHHTVSIKSFMVGCKTFQFTDIKKFREGIKLIQNA